MGGTHRIGVKDEIALTETLNNDSVEREGDQYSNEIAFGPKNSGTSSRKMTSGEMGKRCVSGLMNICPYLSDTEIHVRKFSLGQKVKTSEPDLLDGSILAGKGKGCVILSLASI